MRANGVLHISTLALLAPLFLVAALVIGCQRGADGKQEQPERAAARAYSEAATAVQPLQQAFLDVWKSGRECESAETLRALGNDKVLPALDAYIAALAAMPVPAKGELFELHGGLVAAWQGFRADLAKFYARVSADNLPKRSARLEDSWAQLGARIVGFREAYLAHCAAVGLEVRSDDGG